MGTLEEAYEVGTGVVRRDLDHKDLEVGNSGEAYRVTVVPDHHLDARLDRATAPRETCGDRVRQVAGGPFRGLVAPYPEDLEDLVDLEGTDHLGKADHGGRAACHLVLVVHPVQNLVMAVGVASGHC